MKLAVYAIFPIFGALLGLTACQGGGGSAPALKVPGVDQDRPRLPETTKPSGPDDQPVPQRPPAPIPPDAKALWKSYRALHRVVTRNGKQVCANPEDCKLWADRIDPDYLDPQANEIIPQLLSWTLMLSYSGDSTSSTSMSVNVPFFADRGTAQIVDGKLRYDFEGPVYLRGAGRFVLKLHVVLEKKSENTVLMHLDMAGAGQELHDDFELARIAGTELVDPPTEILPGKLAVYEFGEFGTSYRGVRCTISYNPKSRFPIWALAESIHGTRAIPARGVTFKNDEVGLFKSAQALWGSHATVTDSPQSRNMDYYSVFAPVGGTPTEIPVYGVGIKGVKTDAASGAVYEFTKAVKYLCDQIY